MPTTIHSKVQPDLLLLVVCRRDDFSSERLNLSPDSAFLQGSCKKLATTDKFKAHYHLEQQRDSKLTQEAWVVIAGAVRVRLFDIDNTPLWSGVLNAGDCSITFRGGHTMDVLEEGTLLYEFKNGPYNGKSADKQLIEE
jgi:hypothetical protein